MFLGVYTIFFCLQTLIRPSVTWSRNRLSSNQWILRHVLKFKPLFFQNRAGSEWHPSDQAMQCSVFTLQCYMLSSGSWQVFHGVGLGMFSHKLADYCIMIAHLTSNSFEGNSCWPHGNYLPSLHLRYSPLSMVIENE
jgi:hypothetical protein